MGQAHLFDALPSVAFEHLLLSGIEPVANVGPSDLTDFNIPNPIYRFLIVNGWLVSALHSLLLLLLANCSCGFDLLGRRNRVQLGSRWKQV